MRHLAFLLTLFTVVPLRALAAEPATECHIGWARKHFDADLPFSFIYGGKSSREILSGWRRSIQDERVDEMRWRRTLTLTDPATNLEVLAAVTVFTDTPAIDWTLHFTNKGAVDSQLLEQVKAVDVIVDASERETPPILHRLRPHTENWLPFDQPLTARQPIEFAPINGRSSDGACPFFSLSWGNGGVVTAIGWTGQWTASVEQTAEGLYVTAGMRDMRLKLHPGETIRSPRIMQVYWRGNDPWYGYNQFRRVMLGHVMPRIDGQVVAPPIAHLSTAFYEADKGTEADVLAHVDSLRGMGFEYFWLDAFYGKDDFPVVGNYVLPLLRGFNQTRFPRGAKPIGDAVRREGMRFLMWFEPEAVCPGTLMAQEHPEWVMLHLPGHGTYNRGMLNLGVPEAREYLTGYLNMVIKEFGISCLRFDNAVSYAELWERADQSPTDRRGIAEIRYVEGLYRMWDDILEANPSLFIDNCASGGGRIDLETCSRSIPLWRTDATIDPMVKRDFNQTAIQNQAITSGLNRYLPFSTSGQMGATPYLFRSGLNGGGIAFCEDVRPKDYPRDLLKQAIVEAKRLRPYFFGDFYTINDVTLRPDDWCIMQYDRPEQHDGMVVAFRRPQSPSSEQTTVLHGIDCAAEYQITRSDGYQPSAPRQIAGSDLKTLRLQIDENPGSVVIEYRKLQQNLHFHKKRS